MYAYVFIYYIVCYIWANDMRAFVGVYVWCIQVQTYIC